MDDMEQQSDIVSLTASDQIRKGVVKLDQVDEWICDSDVIVKG